MRLLLSGYYGFENIGDEALLEVVLDRLRAQYSGADIEVLSANPQATARRHGVEVAQRWDAKAVRRAIDRTDVVLSGGGGLLQNSTSLRSLLYYAGILRAGVRAKKRTMIFAQSIGPLDVFGKAVVRECCKHVDAATVRDARSQSLLRSLLPGLRVERCADPVFLYNPPAETGANSVLGTQGGELVIVSVRKAPGIGERTAAIARAVDRLAQAHGARVAFLPFGGPPDAEISAKVIRASTCAPVLLPECSPGDAASIIARAKAVIGMRLHALIFAARYRVPFLAIPYDPKVSALCEDLEYPLPPLLALREPTPTGAAIDTAIDRFWTERSSLAQALAASQPRLSALAQRNFEVLDEVMRDR